MNGGTCYESLVNGHVAVRMSSTPVLAIERLILASVARKKLMSVVMKKTTAIRIMPPATILDLGSTTAQPRRMGWRWAHLQRHR